MLGKLPKKWIYVSLSELFKLIRGVSYSKQDSSNDRKPNYLPIFRANNIGKGQVIYENFIYVDKKYMSEEQLVKPDDILIAMSSGSKSIVGKAAQIKNSWEGSFGAFCSVARPLNSIDGHYLNHFLQSGLYRDFISKLSTGININNIRQEYFDEIKIPLPPLPEQKRISASLDTLFESFDTIQSRLDYFPKIIAELRRQILHQAVTGKLTRNWRKKNGKLAKWKRKTLSSVAEMRLGKMLDQSKNRGVLTPYLRNINVRWFSFNIDNLSKIRITKQEKVSLDIRNGDVLVCEGGEPGRCAVWNLGKRNVTFQKAIHRVRLDGYIKPLWFAYNLKNDADNQRLTDYFTGTTIKHFTGQSLDKYEFAVPSKQEQGEIVKRVQTLFRQSDKVERQFQRLKEQCIDIPQAMLSKAYSGKLIPQNPKDEPVDKLLERIREEKARLFEEKKELRTTKARKKAGRTIMAERKRKELLEVTEAISRKTKESTLSGLSVLL